VIISPLPTYERQDHLEGPTAIYLHGDEETFGVDSVTSGGRMREKPERRLG
jgi:hypothetical protein